MSITTPFISVTFAGRESRDRRQYLDAFVIIIIYNDLPKRILPLCLGVKLKSLGSGLCPPVDVRKEEINISPT